MVYKFITLQSKEKRLSIYLLIIKTIMDSNNGYRKERNNTIKDRKMKKMHD